jgi:hypothetical protein
MGECFLKVDVGWVLVKKVVCIRLWNNISTFVLERKDAEGIESRQLHYNKHVLFWRILHIKACFITSATNLQAQCRLATGFVPRFKEQLSVLSEKA